MFNTCNLKIIFITFLLNLLSACSLSSSDYGPFTLVIESEDGKKVEDMIVTLMFGGSGGHGKYSTYNETQVVHTGEKIIFPRGYVTGTKDEAFGMYLSIRHPDYTVWPSRGITIYTKQKNEEIDLEISYIKLNEVSEKDISRLVKQGSITRVKGRSIREPISRGEAIIIVKRSRFYMQVNSYLVKAISIGRSDIVEKRIKLKLQDIYGDDVNSEEAKLFEKKIRDSIDYFLKY